ncbi:MAG: response regulator, partial [Candidatus Kapaibacterium sp.]
RENPATAQTPVVIVTALNDVANQLRAIESGADDFLSKPIEEKLLTAKVKMLATLNQLRRRAEELESQLHGVL